MDMDEDQKPLPVGLTQKEMDRVNEILKRVEDAKLPGETDGWSVFRITFDDGCQQIRHTSKVIAWKVEELCNPEHRLADPWLVMHDREMGKTLECLASGLQQGQALASRNRMVKATQEEAEARRQAGEKKTCAISELLNSQRTGMRHGFHQSFGPDHFAGWPATVPTERLERAIQYVRDRMRIQPNMQDLPTSGDNNLDMDMFLTAHSMKNSYRPGEVDLTPLDAASDEDFLPALRQILEGLETEHHFACAIIDNIAADRFSTETTISITDIFTLAKHPDWMGLSTSLPNLRDHHVTSSESLKHPLSPSVMIGVPDVIRPEPILQPLTAPQVGIQTLAEIAAWHGAASFKWLPAEHRP